MTRAKERRDLVNRMIIEPHYQNFQHIEIPSLQAKEMYTDERYSEKSIFSVDVPQGHVPKILVPGFIPCMTQLAKNEYRDQRDIKLYFIEKCFRKEALFGEALHFGVYILNPTQEYEDMLIKLSRGIMANRITECQDVWYRETYTKNLKLIKNKESHFPFINNTAFEYTYKIGTMDYTITLGGMFEGGIGFTIVVDRLMMIEKNK